MDNIKKENFVNYTLEEDKNKDVIVISLKLNKEDQALLKACKSVLEQNKNGTAIKSLVHIGAKVLLDEKTSYILGAIFKNKKNNKRNNIFDFD